MIRTKRVYEEAVKEDGTRVLVDRLWPRGISKKAARIDEWLKEVAPSDKLRKWFAHDPKRWQGFEQKYTKELETKKDLIEKLRSVSRNRTLTLLYSARDELHNQAIVLKEFLESDIEVTRQADTD